MVNGCNPSHGNDKHRGNAVAKPDTEPGLPPGQAVHYHGRRDHPCVLGDCYGMLEDVSRIHTTLNESAIQKATKFSHFHCRLSRSTNRVSIQQEALEEYPTRFQVIIR